MLRKGIIIGDRYEIIEQIGTGGMSDVYKAKCHKLNRFVAVKVLKKEFMEDKNFVSKFRVEAQSAAGLSHPNIVSVYDVGSEDGLEYIVMELIEGITLKKYIERKGRLAVKEATSIAIQVAQGIEAAHRNHIIHRDIKPQNIVISKEGKVKVTDFGIARAASANTINSSAMGSVHYISPEQARGGFVDEKSDIYSLGVVMFEMITGKVPFEGDSTVSIALRHIQDEIPRITEIAPEAPISISRIVEKCTQKKPDGRYLKVSSLIADLKKSLVMPNEDFVQIVPVETSAATVMISEDEVSVIRTESEGGIKGKIKGFTEEFDMPDFSDDELDEEIKEDNPKMDKMIKIGAIIAGAVVIIIAAILLFNFFGGFSGCSGNGTGIVSDTEFVEMPDVTGMSEGDAEETLTALGIKVSFEYEESNDIDAGKVISQSEDEGDKVKIGSRVTLTVSAGSEEIEIPTLSGETKENAIKILTDLGLKYTTSEEFSNDYDIGKIIKTDPDAGDKVSYGAKITLYVSRGADDMTVVPDLMGDPLGGVAAQLGDLNETIVHVPIYIADGYSSSDDGTVIAQSLTPGVSVAKGSAITVTIGDYAANRDVTVSSVAHEQLTTTGLVDGDAISILITFYKNDGVTTVTTKTSSGVYGETWSYTGQTYSVPSSAAKYKIEIKKASPPSSTLYSGQYDI